VTNTLQYPIHVLVDAKANDHLLGSSNLSQACVCPCMTMLLTYTTVNISMVEFCTLQAIPAGQSAVFSIRLRSTSAKAFRHAVEFIINGLHFLHFDIHADVIDPMLSVSNSELEFALSNNDWKNHVDKVVLLENPNKFPCSFEWQVPSPSAFTVTPMTGNIKASSSLDTVIRWTQDKDAAGTSTSQARLFGGMHCNNINIICSSRWTCLTSDLVYGTSCLLIYNPSQRCTMQCSSGI
jgi:hypothetical protein